MAKYKHPSLTEGTVLIRGVKFVDGATAEVTVSDDTAEYFKAIGITEVIPPPADKATVKPRK